MTLGSLIDQGGPVMYPLLACSVVSLGFILERMVFFLLERQRLNLTLLEGVVKDYAVQARESTPCAPELGDVSAGIPCQAKHKVVSEQVKSYLASADLTRAVRYLQIESSRTYEQGLASLGGLETIATVAPLLGILGTVFGIMEAFQGLDLQSAGTPAAVGAGLAEAMLTTAVGLVVAVPTLIFYNIFLGHAEKNAARLQGCSDALLLK